MKTKKPIAILYNWYKKGEFILRSEIYHEEHLYDEVIVYSLDSTDNIFNDVSNIKPDIIVSFGVDLDLNNKVLKEKYMY